LSGLLIYGSSLSIFSGKVNFLLVNVVNCLLSPSVTVNGKLVFRTESAIKVMNI